ncbi:MAG: four helix bundle protein [Candidatus Omnitrophica bacterium]|nr:four helix bundle protein [Candidatus Omnitrophota bacterium]
MKIERFEDIQAWQEARVLVKMVYDNAKNSTSLGKDYRFKDQITAAAVSVMANISEGFSRRSNKEFIQFLFIAKASIAETQSHLYVALDQGYLNKEKFNMVYQQADKVARLVSNFLTYLLKHNKHN